MVSPRQFCFDTLGGRGPRSARGPPEAMFQNGVQIRVQNGVQKWGPNWDPKMGSKMGSKNGVQIRVQNGFQKWIQKWGQNWDPKMGLPSLRAATTTNKNEKSPLSVSSGSGCWPLGGGTIGGDIEN